MTENYFYRDGLLAVLAYLIVSAPSKLSQNSKENITLVNLPLISSIIASK